MEIEITKPYNRFRKREDENMRVINVYGDTYNFDILIGLVGRNITGTPSTIMMGGDELIYKASIAVGTNLLGEMRLIKNRYGIDGTNDEHGIRQTIMDCVISIGFTHFEALQIITAFNRCLTEITDEPVLYMKEFPYGITHRRYMMDEYKKSIIKKYGIKRHKLI